MWKGRQNRKAGAGCGILFGLGWTAFSCIFLVLGIRETWKAARVSTWEEVPCRVERFEIGASRDREPPFIPEVVFHYRLAGRHYTGTRLWLEQQGVDDYEDLARLREHYLGGASPVCRVDPEDPGNAVLEIESEQRWGGLLFTAFGSGFVLIGIGIVAASITGARRRRARSASADEQPDTPGGRLLTLGFFGIFALAGLAALLGFVVPRAIDFVSMQRWAEVPGEVIWSTVRSHSSDDGTTYSVDLFYRYRFDGREHRSNRWNVTGSSSSGRKGKQKVVDAHPPGTAITCYVDPQRPWRAVANRKLGWWALFGLFPLPFLAIGFGGLWYSLVRQPKTANSRTGEAESIVTKSGGREKKPRSVRSKRVLAFVGAIFIAAFWNGIVGVFLGVAWKGWQKGDPEWFLIVFMIPFVLIGIFLLLHVPYRLLAIFSPVYDLRLPREALKPGDHFRVSWRRTGGGGKPRRLSLWLVGREEATYRQGTRTSTATSVFHEERLFETETPQMMPAGVCDLDIPADAVPSFSGKHNKIRWIVRIVAEVPWRPDVRDEHELPVRAFQRNER